MSDENVLGNGKGFPYILYYRQGSNPYPQFFLFHHPSSDMRTVMERIRKHCEIVNLKFVNVRPAFVDLAQTEARAVGALE